jgi:hypothetical protein
VFDLCKIHLVEANHVKHCGVSREAVLLGCQDQSLIEARFGRRETALEKVQMA